MDFSNPKAKKAKRMPRFIPKVTLAFWTTEEHLNIRLFARWWEAKNKTDPRHFPLQLPEGDWDEQYAVWCDAHATQKAQANKKQRPLEKTGFSKAIAQELACESVSEDPDSEDRSDTATRKALQA